MKHSKYKNRMKHVNPYGDEDNVCNEPVKHNTLPDYNFSRPLGAPKFKVIYHINNDNITNIHQFLIDNNVYYEGDDVEVKAYNAQHISSDGMTAYKLAGWSLNTNNHYAIDVEPGQTIKVDNKDIHLYAQWKSDATVTVSNDGGLSIKEDFQSKINHLNIPEYYRGKRITKIVAPGLSSSNLRAVVIPPSIKEIESGTFTGWQGSSITFIEAEISEKYPGLTLGENLFEDTPNLHNIILPYRLISFDKAFPKQDKLIDIYVRHRKEYMATVVGTSVSEIEGLLSDDDDPVTCYTRNIHWGYNE